MEADCIIVLGGGVTKEGKLTKSSTFRMDKAIELYKAKSASAILCSGKKGLLVLDDRPIPEAVAMAEYAQEKKIPKNALYTEIDSHDTIGNAFFSKIHFCQPQHWKELIIVTSDTHLQRAQYVFEHIFGPHFHLRFVTSPSFLSSKEKAYQQAREEKILELTQSWLSPLTVGSDIALQEFMHLIHPAHAENPPQPLYEIIEVVKAIDEDLKQKFTKS